MAVNFGRRISSWWSATVSVVCAALLICAPGVEASTKTHHKSLSRLKAGLASVRESESIAKERLDALKKREQVLTQKSKPKLYPVTSPEMQPSLEAVTKEVSSLKSNGPKALHKKLLSLYENGHAQAVSLLVGANERESGALSASEVRKGLLNFDSKSEVLTLIEKVEAANSEPNINSSYLATEELRKIRFERKALLKKVAKCEDDEQTILAEMKVVKREDSEVVAQSDVEFAKPVSGKVTSAFGSRIHPIDHVEKEHKGIDFAGEIGDPVKAAADGKVIFAGEQRGFGKIVIVQHSNSLTTAYAHLSEINVQVGEEVDKGQKVGEIGMTGNSTGPHLHFEIRENGDAVNPANYL